MQGWNGHPRNRKGTVNRLKRFVVLGVSVASLAGIATTSAELTASAAPQISRAVLNGGHGHITATENSGDPLCLTANTAAVGASVHLNVCRVADAALQTWTIGWIRQNTSDASGVVLVCLTSHPDMCVGVGTWDNKDKLAGAYLYSHKHALKHPAEALRNALTMVRSTRAPKGYKFRSTSLAGTFLTTLKHGRAGRHFGQIMVWRRNIEKGALIVWSIPPIPLQK
jgi:hypothetical protein